MKIFLSEKQTARLFPLEVQLIEVAQKNPKKKGMILAQILVCPGECMEINAKFIDNETAIKINAILKENGYGEE